MAPTAIRTAVTAPSALGVDGAVRLADIRVGFRQGFAFELIDRRSGVIESLTLVLNPRQYTVIEPFQQVLTPVEDGTVFAEEAGIVTRDITIEGTFGLREKSANGGELLGGNEHFMRLRALFRRYSDLKRDIEGENYVLVFHSFKDDDHWIVAPVSFETPRDAKSTRTHYEYRIQMKAIGDAASLGVGLDLQVAENGNVLQHIHEAFHDARAFFADINADVGQLRRKLGNVPALLNQTAGLINLVRSLVDNVAEFIPASLGAFVAGIEDVVDASDDLADAIVAAPIAAYEDTVHQFHRLETAMCRIAAIKDKFQAWGDDIANLFDGENGLTNHDLRNYDAGATIGSRTRALLGSYGAEAGLDLTGYTSTATHTVTAADTIESIASRYGTDPEAIILINALRAPYILRGGGPGIAEPGDVLTIPMRTGGDATASAPYSAGYLDAEDFLYGVDVAMDEELFFATGRFDIRVDDTHDAMDAALVRGIDNVVQGTRITIETERGSNAYLPDIGIQRPVGHRGTLSQLLLASLRLREAFLADPRIEGIQSSRIVLDGDVLEQEITPIVRGKLSAPPIVTPFGKAAGEGA